jgi:hypothetical protein
MMRDRLAPKVRLGNQQVMGTAQQAEVVGIVAAPEPVGIPMVELEAVTLGASSALLVHEAASTPVASVYRAPNRGRDMP